MERKKNEALGRPMLTKKVDMSVFVRTLVYEVRTAAQSVAGATARAGADASASVGAGAEAVAGACRCQNRRISGRGPELSV